MRRITIIAKDYTGLLADITEKLSEQRINIDSIEAEKVDTTALIRIISDQAEQAFTLLTEAGFNVVSHAGLLVKLVDEAGALAKVSRLLAQANIDIRGINMVEQHDGYRIVALSCSDTERASQVLGSLVL